MKTLIGAIVLMLATLAQPAAAQWRNFGGRHYDVQSQRQGQGQGGYQRPQRDYRQPDYRQPDYRQPDRRSEGRMTDEERRNLRRDLDRANREIYKGR